eukprot:6484499-Amphidinium_carterae.1
MVLPDVIPSLLRVYQLAQQVADDDLDEVVQKLSQFYLSNCQYHICSGQVMETLMDADATQLQMKVNRLACMIWLWQCHDRMAIERAFVNAFAPENLLLYLDMSSFDETPVQLRLHEVQLNKSSNVEEMAAAAGVPQPQPVLMEQGQVVIVKLLQIQNSSVFLVRIGGQVAAMAMDFHTPLQSMDANNSSVLARCLSRLSGVTEAAEAWRLKVRGLCCDQAPYNMKAERLLHSLNRDWVSNLFICEIHTVSNIHNKAFEALFPSDISGSLHLAMSVRTQGAWATFKKAVIAELRSRDLK